MRPELKIAIGALFLGSVIFGVQHRSPSVVVVAENKGSEISREIASLSENAAAPEAFEFQRKIQARMVTKAGTKPKSFADLSYAGKFFVEWQKSSKRVARFSFLLSSGQRSSGAIEATLDQDNRLVSLRAPSFTSEFDEDTVSVLKDLVSIYAYHTDEDTTGKYESRWSNRVKSKVKYLSPKLASIQITKSEHHIEFDADKKTPILFTGVEESSMKSSQEPVLFSHSEYTLKKIKLNAADLKLASGSKLNEKLKEETLQLTESMNPYTHIAWESVRPQLDTLSSLSPSARLSVFHSLVHALKTNPEKLGELADFIRKNLTDPTKANLAIGAMATVGTPEAQRALTGLYQEIAQSGAHPELQHSILGAFTTTDATLNADTRGFLNSLVSTSPANANESAISENAAFALGSAMQKDSDASAEKKLSDYYAAATTSAQKMASLDAMGNSGDANFIPVLQQNLNSTDAAVREKAVFSARFIQDSRVSGIFNQAMNDSDVRVSVAAVQAIPYQADPKSYTSLLQKCSGSSNSQLSQLCAKTLGSLN